MLQFKKLQLKLVKQEERVYSFAELKNFIDFEVKRLYYVQGSTKPTGQHCHFIEKEMFIMVKGSCTAVIDQGNGKEDMELKGPGDAIYIGNYVWHGFKDFSSDSVLLAVSSTNYKEDRSDYLEDYDEYLKIRDEKKVK
jgi:mannose-6-phosphate isomerase-like protein (cupin superfamily)